MAHLLTSEEYAAFRRLIDAGAMRGRGVTSAPGVGSAFSSRPGQVHVIHPRRGGAAIKKFRLRPDGTCIEASRIDDPTDWSDAECQVQVSACPSQLGRSLLSGTTSAGEEGGGVGMTFSGTISNSITIDTADTSMDGSGGGTTQLCVAGAAGGVLVRVMARATGSTDECVIRLFHQPGGTGTKFFIAEIAVSATVASNANQIRWSGEWVPPDLQNYFPLAANDKIFAATTVSQQFVLTAIGLNI